jgi:hypothetical protein
VQRLEATDDVRTKEGTLEAGEWTKAAAHGPKVRRCGNLLLDQ